LAITSILFDTVVDRLKYEHENPNLKQLITRQLGSDTSPPMVFRVYGEIKRISKPSMRPFRIEQYIHEIKNITQYHHEAKIHHVESVTLRELTHMLDHYKMVYTIGIEEHLVRFVKRKKEDILHAQSTCNVIVETLDISERTYRKDERMYLGEKVIMHLLNNCSVDNTSDLKSLVANSNSAYGVTQNISCNGLLVKSDSRPTIGQKCLLRFPGFEADFVFTQPYILYECVDGISDDSGDANDIKSKHMWAMKKIELPQHAEFDKFTENLISSHRNRYSVDLKNVEKSVLNQMSEQFFTNRQEYFTIFSTKENKIPLAFGSIVSRQTYLHLDHNNNSIIHPILTKEKIIERSLVAPVYFVVIKQSNGTVFSKALINSCDAERLFFMHAATRNDALFFVANSYYIDKENAFLSHSLPSSLSASKKIQRQRRLTDYYAKNTRDVIARLHIATNIKKLDADFIKKITPKASILTHGQQNDFSSFAVDTKSPPPLRYIVARGRELRQEDRFSLKTPVVIECRGVKLHGVTEDISESGCSITTPEPTFHLKDQVITVHFPSLPNIGSIPAMAKYQVINSTNGSLRLFSPPNGRFSANTFMGPYLDRHFNELEPVLERDESGTPLIGLERALRNIQNSVLPYSTLLFQPRGATHIPAHVNSSRNSCRDPIYLAINNKSIGDEFYKTLFCHIELQKIISTAIKAITPESPFFRHLLLFSTSISSGELKLLRLYTEKELTGDNAAKITDALKARGQAPLWYQIDITRKAKVFDRYYREELDYIEGASKHKGGVLYDVIRNTTGIVSLTPLNDYMGAMGLTAMQHQADRLLV
jgi:hypothetical protein